MQGASFIRLQHLNLIFSVETRNLRSIVNFHSHHMSVSGSNQNVSNNNTEIQEAYGEYIFSNLAGVRGGFFFVPLTPENGNLMFWGSVFKEEFDYHYYFYLTNGVNGSDGRQDKDLGVGGRFLREYTRSLQIRDFCTHRSQ